MLVLLPIFTCCAYAQWSLDPPEEYAEYLQQIPKVDPLNPRRHIFLDGRWELKKDGEFVWRSAVVPLPWQMQFPDLWQYAGSVEYRKRITIPSTWVGEPWLVCGAADYAARVTVNDRYVGIHEGGYTPFAFSLAPYVKPGEDANISIIVTDSWKSGDVRDYPYAEIPHGKQSWYGDASGLWQSVRIEERARTHVTNLKVTPVLERSSARVEVNLSQSPSAGTGTLFATVYAPRSKAPVSQLKVPLSSSTRYIFDIPIPNASLWSPDDPALYTLNTSITTEQGSMVDQYETSFGMRSFAVRNGVMHLNEKPIFLAGVLDQDFYPLTHYTPPSEEYVRAQFLELKRLGINLLRCHIKIPDPVYLRMADEVGLLVWYELPNVDKLTKNARGRLTDLLRRSTDRDYNHPSLVIISIFNESWGIDLSDPEQRKWMAAAFDTAKKLNPTRLIVDNSACCDNYHVKTDIADFHAYFSIPDHAEQMSRWAEDFSNSPDWLFSPHGDAVRTGNEALILSEFGNWSLPNLDLIRQCYGDELPWWFQTGGGNLQPQGVEDRFYQYGLNHVFTTFDRFARATQEMQLLALKYQIEELRRHRSIGGYVWTEFTDLQWEANGLLDYCRNVKTSARILPYVSEPRCVIARPDARNHYSGQPVRTTVYLSNFGEPLPPDTVVQWQLEGFTDVRGQLEVSASVDAPGAVEAGAFSFEAPDVRSHRASRLIVRWMHDGEVLAQNHEELNFLEREDPGLGLRVFVDGSLEDIDGLASWLKGFGMEPIGTLMGADIAITSRLTPAIAGWTGGGGRTLLMVRDERALGRQDTDLRILSRDRKGRWGDWCTTFNWFSKGPAFDGFTTRPMMMDWGFENLIPRFVVEGVSRWDDVQSGIFTGWVHDGAATVLRAGSSDSRLLICTLPLLEAAEGDPLADRLMVNLLQELSSPIFPVRAEWDLGAPAEEALLPAALDERVQWAYTFEEPSENWTEPDFDDSSWERGDAGFGDPQTPGARVGTRWDNHPSIWLRWTGTLNAPEERDILLAVHHDEDAKVYLNGERIWQGEGFSTDYQFVELPEDTSSKLDGEVTVAVRCRHTSGGRYIDAGLYAR